MMEEGTRNVLSPSNMWRMGVMWVLALLWSYFKLLHAKLVRTDRAFPRQPPDMQSNLACVVTGASSGIGKATAEALALKGYYVILAGRSLSRLSQVVKEFELQYKGISVKALEVDLCSITSIVKFAQTVEKLLEGPYRTISLQLLINNAGVLSTTNRKTSEGGDFMIASNYLGHFMLTQQLLPLMQRSKWPARIVNVGSFTHRCVQDVDIILQLLQTGEFQVSNRDAVYQIARVYEASKLFMVVFSYELHRRLNCGSRLLRISTVCADPGVVRTEIWRELPRWLTLVVTTGLKMVGLLQSPHVGCNSVLDGALAPSGVSGKYFFGGDGHVVASSALSYDDDLARSVWMISDMMYNEALNGANVVNPSNTQKAACL